MDKNILKSTHEGKLKIGESELDVAVLEDGKRIITLSGVFQALDRPVRGTSRIDQTPTFMDAKNLQPFVNEELKGLVNKVEYISKNGKITDGYDAKILPLVADLYLQVRSANALLKSQIETAIKAEILVRSLAKVGITALVDEATGYQYDREKDALQVILKAFVTEELLKWQKMFPDTFYYEIFRLNGWDYSVKGIKNRPGVIGKWTNELIYNQLPKGVLEELKAKTPKSNEGNYTARFFQSLTPDIGHPALTAQLYKVIGLMNISNNWNEFKSHFNRMVDRANGQTEIDFDRIEKDIAKEDNKAIQLSAFDQKLKKGLDFNPNTDKN